MRICSEAESYCVVGAGPSGLAVSRALSRLDIPHVVYEKHSAVGGIWNTDNPGSPVYRSAHFISSKWTSGFTGFPMPAEFADYPHHTQVLRYLRDFADAFGLHRHVRLNAEVDRIEPRGPQWKVTLKDGSTAQHRGVICANGVTWLPALPQWPGAFTGELGHAVSYRSPAQFEGKRVLIVGLGNSGADIACEAARHALSAAVSVRRGYHFLPKHVYGWSIDVFLRCADLLPPAIKALDLRAGIFATVGDTRRFGMPAPDHEPGQSHPLLNTQLLHHLGHGDIEIRPDIERLDGRGVVFKDGSHLEVDLILAATGYRVSAPYLDEALFEWAGERPAQYMNVFNRRHHELFTVGFAEVAAGIYPLIEQMAHLLAHHLNDRLRRPQAARAFELWQQRDDFDPRGGKHFIESNRHANYVDLGSYTKQASALCAKFEWPALSAGTFSRLPSASQSNH